MKKSERIESAYRAGWQAAQRGENLSRQANLIHDHEERAAFIKGYYYGGLAKSKAGKEVDSNDVTKRS